MFVGFEFQVSRTGWTYFQCEVCQKHDFNKRIKVEQKIFDTSKPRFQSLMNMHFDFRHTKFYNLEKAGLFKACNKINFDNQPRL